MIHSKPIVLQPVNDPEDDQALILEAQRNPDRFKPLYLKWVTPIYRFLYYQVRNAADAEDLTSQVFLKAYQKLPYTSLRGPFSSWLYAIARNTARDYFRKKHQDLPLEVHEPIADGLDLLAQTIKSDELLRLDRLIRALPEAEQDLIRLRFVAELSYDDIGKILNRKEDAVRKSISRLLTRLSSQMEKGNE